MPEGCHYGPSRSFSGASFLPRSNACSRACPVASIACSEPVGCNKDFLASSSSPGNTPRAKEKAPNDLLGRLIEVAAALEERHSEELAAQRARFHQRLDAVTRKKQEESIRARQKKTKFLTRLSEVFQENPSRFAERPAKPGDEHDEAARRFVGRIKRFAEKGGRSEFPLF